VQVQHFTAIQLVIVMIKRITLTCLFVMFDERHVVCLLLELHSDLDNMVDVERPFMFILISSVLTWARTKPVDPVTLHF